ncbi:M20/M25/M40 family metallo-hydrolase [Nannocystis bainbridge]|uniref:M20/M25/M40 family metallo-hydrolase n=1 Tax=Nannocystis bainbridge TaxID=2995303 RepID=A0ABT5EBJ7_9BACT|nr:M20/M25/M40 family metallo-hydrolase [Nannocystis bainbridge]MDC0722161.1 M20/M25/M40 family metallo-hydrolase [Nannocystis bainbridge]
MQLVRGARATSVASGEFSISPQTASGEVQGAAVFVGYAAASEVTPGDDDAAAPIYDDLAGLDLKGKIAVVLLDAPGRPDTVTFFRRLQREAGDFAAAAAPLKQSGDAAGLRALHERTRGRVIAILQRFMPEADLKDMWPLPADPLTVELDLQALVGPVMREAGKRKGPQFGMGAGSLRTKVERLTKAGAVAVIAVRGPRSFLDAEEREADAFAPLQREDGVVGEPFALPVVQMKWKAADRLLRVGKAKQKISAVQEGIDTKLAPLSGDIPGVELKLSASVEPIQVEVPNVLAKISGTDLRDEIVVLGAHYDHIGVVGRGECSEARKDDVVDGICNGADDNASGTAMLLELARHFREQRPRRTVVFAHFAGEELGLLGSKALAERPPFALDKVVAMVNLDMIGRLGPKGLAVGGLVSSDAWMPLLDRLGTAGLSVLYEASVATRSDHASFYKKSLPVLFFFTGTHADYHRPGDHADKINYDGLVAIGTLVGGVARAVADGLPVPYKAPPEGGGLASGLPGSNPDTVVKRVQGTSTPVTAPVAE